MSDAWIGVIASFVTALFSLIGVIATNNSSRKLIVYRIGELEKKVDKHNNLVERMTVVEGRITEVEHDIQDLKKRPA